MQVVLFTVLMLLFIVFALIVAFSFSNGMSFMRMQKSLSNRLLNKKQLLLQKKDINYKYQGKSYNPREEEDVVQKNN